MTALRHDRLAGWLLFICLLMGCDAGDGPFAPTVDAPQIVAPSPISSSQIDLVWIDRSASETGFEVQLSTASPEGPFSLLSVTAANITSFMHSDLEPEKAYCYRVRAFETIGKRKFYSEFSEASCATTPETAPMEVPAAPSEFIADLESETMVGFSWMDNATNEDGFTVRGSADGGATWPFGGGVAGVRTNEPGVTGWTPGFASRFAELEQEVCYLVVAYNALGDSPPSNAQCVVRLARPVELKAAVADAQTLELSWIDRSSFEDGYEVQRARKDAPFETVALLPPNSSSYQDVGVSAGTSWWYRVRATRDAGGSSFSEPLAAVLPGGPPAAPATSAGGFGSTTILIYWWDNAINQDGISLAQSFRVERSTEGGAQWVALATTDVSPGTSALRRIYWHEDAGRATEQEACYRVVAVNVHGDSPPSDTDCATPLAAPTGLEAIPVDDWTLDLRWVDNSGSESAYHVWGPCRDLSCYYYYLNKDIWSELPANSTSIRLVLPELDEHRLWYAGCTFTTEAAVSDDWDGDLGIGGSGASVTLPGTPSRLCQPRFPNSLSPGERSMLPRLSPPAR